MALITPPIKNIREVSEPLKEQILKGDVHTIDEMRAWLKPLGYSETRNEAAINFILLIISRFPRTMVNGKKRQPDSINRANYKTE